MDRIQLWPNGAPGYKEEYGQPQPNLKPFLLGAKNSPACVVVPGGGYSHLGTWEGDAVAHWLNSLGIVAFVLEYRFKPYTYHEIKEDGRRAVRVVRAGAEEYGIDPNRIAMIGFSAGGHLTGCTSVFYDAPLEKVDEIDEVSSRPDASILCYAVLSGEEGVCETSSFENFLADEFSLEMINQYAIDQHVRPDMPPVFLWHAVTDFVVSVKNSMLTANALIDAGVPVEMHIYPDGSHGMGLGGRDGRIFGCEGWVQCCADWLKRQFKI